MSNMGDMAKITPRLLCMQLSGGHSEFWNQLPTVTKVINKQPNLETKLAALVTIPKAIGLGNHWSFYIDVDHKHREKGWTFLSARLPIFPRWLQLQKEPQQRQRSS